MALDWTHPQDAAYHTTPGGSSLDPRWKKSQKKTQGNVASDSGQGAENKVTWETLEKKAQNKPEWRSLVLALCARGHEEDKVSNDAATDNCVVAPMS
nr:hypothetical protein BaRGS_024705 [Batillaria attramentaria]